MDLGLNPYSWRLFWLLQNMVKLLWFIFMLGSSVYRRAILNFLMFIIALFIRFPVRVEFKHYPVVYLNVCSGVYSHVYSFREGLGGTAYAAFQPHSMVPPGFAPASHSIDVWSNSAMVEKKRPLVIQIYGYTLYLFFYCHDMVSVHHILSDL